MVWRRLRSREDITALESRQSILDRPALMILLASAAMVCLVFGLLLLRY